MYQIGQMYESGQGVAQDYDEAMKWYRKAADAGNTYAKNQLHEIEMMIQQSRMEQKNQEKTQEKPWERWANRRTK